MGVTVQRVGGGDGEAGAGGGGGGVAGRIQEHPAFVHAVWSVLALHALAAKHWLLVDPNDPGAQPASLYDCLLYEKTHRMDVANSVGTKAL